MSTPHDPENCRFCFCAEDDCDEHPWALGLCLAHYRRRRYWQDPEKERARRRARYARQKTRREAA